MNPSQQLANQLGFGGAPSPSTAPVVPAVPEVAVPTPEKEPGDTQTLIDRSGKPVYFAHDKVQDALLSGKYGLQPGETVPVAYNNHIGQVTLDKLPGVIEAGGRVATPKEFEEHVLQRDYGDMAHGLEAFGYNAINTAMMDIPSALMPDDWKESVRKSVQANPNAAMAGTGVGLVAPIVADVATGGALTPALGPELLEAGGVARAAGKLLANPTGAATLVGDLAEAGIKKLVGNEASSLAGKIIEKGVVGAARGAVEMPVYGAAQLWGEENLKDKPELTGEKLWNVVSQDFFTGAELGGGLGVAAAGLRGVVGNLTREEGLINSQATKMALDAIDKDGSLTKGEDALSKREQEAARHELLKKDPVTGKAVIEGAEKIDDIAPKVADKRAQAEREFNRVFDNPYLDRLHLDGNDFVRAMGNLDDLPLGAKDAINNIIDASRVEAKGAVSVTEAAKVADAILNHAVKLPPSEQKISFEVVNRIDDLLTNQVTKKRAADQGFVELLADKSVDPKKIADYFHQLDERLPIAQQNVRIWRRLDEAAQSSLEKANKGGLLAHVKGLEAAGLLGYGIHAVTGHAGVLPVIAAKVAKKLIKDYGHSTAAVILDKLSVIGAARRAAIAEDAAAAKIWNKIKEGDFKSPKPTGDFGKYKLYERAIEKWERDQGALKVGVVTAQVARHAPRIATGFEQAAMRSVAILKQNFPKLPPDPSLLNPKWDKRQPTDQQKAQAGRVFEVIINPTSILQHIVDGTVTPKEVDILKQTHPERYFEMQMGLASVVGKMKNPPPENVLRAMNIFLERPGMDPNTFNMLQANYQSQAPAEGAPGGGKKGKGSANPYHSAPKRSIDVPAQVMATQGSAGIGKGHTYY